MLTVEPSHAAHQIKKNKMKLAMTLGTKRHYRLDEIHGRHFVETARSAKMPDPLIRRAIEDVAARCKAAFADVADALPRDFPADIWEAAHKAAIARLRGLDTAKGEWRG